MDYKSISLFSMESSSRWKIGKKTEKKKAYSFCIHFDVGFRKLIISQM